MAGIYIHIPYCKQACSYCDFYFTTTLSSKDKFLKSLRAEIELQKYFLKNIPIQTIYFGGGTPSMLSCDEINSILHSIRNSFSISANPEITLEANPENLTPDYLKALLLTGVNRLSIGVQSFKDSELKAMNRAHASLESISAIKNAKQVGFENISVDLIYGTPWTNEIEWEKHIQSVIDLEIQHLSCYQLTVEEKTALHHKISIGEEKKTDDEQTEKQFLSLIKRMKEEGFVHYEISNFGKPNYFSKHNTSYWKNIPYLGLGPAAHSYSGTSRFSNISNVHVYCDKIEKGEIWFSEEKLSSKDRYNDLVLTGLRTIFGINLPDIERQLDQSFANYFQRKIQPFIIEGRVVKNGYNYSLKEESFLFADKISADLFYI